jgi:hypothetical protein
MDKAMLEKMRSKLVTARPAEAKPRIVTPRAAAKARKGRRAWVYALAGVAFLSGANVLFQAEKEQILIAMGLVRPGHIAAPPARLNERDKALFWAYAAYDREKLERRFHVGADAIVDPADAEHHLAFLIHQGMAEDLKKEIENVRTAANPAGAGRKTP